MSGTFATPKRKPVEAQNRKPMPIINLLIGSMALMAILAVFGLYMAIKSAQQQQEQHDQLVKRTQVEKHKLIEFHNLHQKRKKNTSEWLRFCELASQLGKGNYSACEVVKWMSSNNLRPLMIKGRSFTIEFESIRHIVDRHTYRYPNSRPNTKGGGRTRFPKNTSVGRILELIQQVVQEINASDFSFEDSYSWTGWKKQVFYVWVNGTAYVLVIDKGLVNTFYPCRESEIVKRENEFVNERK